MNTNTNTSVPVASTRHRLGRRLVAGRKLSGLTQEDLAARLGVTRQAVASWEAADGDISLATLEKWAGLLNLRVALVADGPVTVLVDHTGQPASPWVLSRHAVVTGPRRAEVLAALAADCVELPVLSLDGLVGEPLDEQQITELLASIPARTARPAVVVTELRTDQAHHETVIELLTWGRVNRIVVLIGAETFEDVPADLIQNTALLLRTETDGSLVDLDGNKWSLNTD